MVTSMSVFSPSVVPCRYGYSTNPHAPAKPAINPHQPASTRHPYPRQPIPVANGYGFWRFAWNRKSTPRPPSAKTGMRTSEASQPKTDAPRQRRDRAEKGGSLSAAARDRIYQMAASTQPLPTPPARPPAPPSAPVPPVASVSAPAPPPAGPTPSWPGPTTFSNPVMPDSAWTGPITFARVIQMKCGRCFNCNKKGHVMRTCHAAGQAAIKTTSTQGSRKKKSPALDPTPPSSSGAGTSTKCPASANAKAGPSTTTGKRGDPLFTPANLATLESDTLPPLDWLKPFFTEAQLDDYRDGKTTPVAFQRTLHGILKARVERKLRRRSPVESGDSRPEGGLMLQIPTADATDRGPEEPPSRAGTPDGLDAASGTLWSAREIFRRGLDVMTHCHSTGRHDGGLKTGGGGELERARRRLTGSTTELAVLQGIVALSIDSWSNS
ncbi:hypothetical protein EDB89DRAFT_2081079 [Lactarius sanguifluus]|nr:hypothetical protein EDB89DRAFT_2081079 [Lactarius sanguifluus]